VRIQSRYLSAVLLHADITGAGSRPSNRYVGLYQYGIDGRWPLRSRLIHFYKTGREVS